MITVTLQELETFDGRPQKSGDETRFLCNLSDTCRGKPRDGEHRSLCVNTRNGFYVCHRCGTKGKLKDFWEERPKLNRKQLAHAKLSAQFAPPVKSESAKESNAEHLSENYVEKFKSYRQVFAESQAENYLHKRGILIETAREAGCGYAAAWEHWEKREGKWLLAGVDKRVVFGIYDDKNDLVAIHGRAINDDHHNSSKITKGDKSLGVFFAHPKVLQAKVIAVCEGATDALALTSCGVAAVAMTGTTAPDWIGKKLAFKHVLLATDADEAGDKAADKLKFELEKYGAKIFRLRPRRAKDWAEVIEKSGTEKMRPFLGAFAVNSTEEIKVDSAWRFFQDGRDEAALFTAHTISDYECREILLDRIRKNRSSE